MSESFPWASPVGLSVLLFLAIGVLWILIGLLTVPLHKKANPDTLFVSQSTDTAYFAAPPSQLAPLGLPLSKLRIMLLTVISGLLGLAGCLFVSAALFGLRYGQTWALGALAIAGLAAVLIWAIALLPYFQARCSAYPYGKVGVIERNT